MGDTQYPEDVRMRADAAAQRFLDAIDSGDGFSLVHIISDAIVADRADRPVQSRFGMTKCQLQALSFLKEYMRDHGFPPTHDEIRAHLGLKSKSGVNRLLNGLQDRGFVRRLRYRARAIELVGSA